MSFADFVQNHQQLINRALDEFLPLSSQAPCRLHEAMRYAVLNGGKRIRPLLVFATGELFGAKPEALIRPACAIELIHCYSLVHDDLPAMDNDDLRRGKPTCHIAFDEATAILVGDALQSLAFSLLTEVQESSIKPEILLQMVTILAAASGSMGMAGGQSLDLQASGLKLSLTELETMHRLKTGALIRASVQLGALASGCNSEQFTSLTQFSNIMGLAFQIQDDILDIESNTEILGKRSGADIANDKSTYPALMGLNQAKQRVIELYEEALQYLCKIADEINPLQWLAQHIIKRDH